MRLTSDQIDYIRAQVGEALGPEAGVWLFGSRVDDSLRGGDVDLLVATVLPVERPALLSARLAARISRYMGGRKVDVLLEAPNLARQPIHEVARGTGVRL